MQALQLTCFLCKISPFPAHTKKGYFLHKAQIQQASANLLYFFVKALAWCSEISTYIFLFLYDCMHRVDKTDHLHKRMA